MNYLQKDHIILINRKTCLKHGGNFIPPFNFHNEEPLNYLIDAVEAEMFGAPLYDGIDKKAALYMFSIISNHVFQDGNKRTGLESAILFLRLNGANLQEELVQVKTEDGKLIPQKGTNSTEILIEFTLEVAAGKISLEECTLWFSKNIIWEDLVQ